MPPPFPEYFHGRQQPDVDRLGEPRERTLQDKGNNQQIDCPLTVVVNLYRSLTPALQTAHSSPPRPRPKWSRPESCWTPLLRKTKVMTPLYLFITISVTPNVQSVITSRKQFCTGLTSDSLCSQWSTESPLDLGNSPVQSSPWANSSTDNAAPCHLDSA